MIPGHARASILFLVLLLACGGGDSGEVAEPPAAVQRFTGAQLDRMQQAARSAGLAPAEWLNVMGADDRTRAVVHIRRSDLTEDDVAAHCEAVGDAIAGELLPGQRIEIYVIVDDGISACR